jgi:hypothetical protein
MEMEIDVKYVSILARIYAIEKILCDKSEIQDKELDEAFISEMVKVRSEMEELGIKVVQGG